MSNNPFIKLRSFGQSVRLDGIHHKDVASTRGALAKLGLAFEG